MQSVCASYPYKAQRSNLQEACSWQFWQTSSAMQVPPTLVLYMRESEQWDTHDAARTWTLILGQLIDTL